MYPIAQGGCLGSLPSGGWRRDLGERRYYVRSWLCHGLPWAQAKLLLHHNTRYHNDIIPFDTAEVFARSRANCFKILSGFLQKDLLHQFQAANAKSTHQLRSLAQITKLFALLGCVIFKSSAESPLASLLPAGRDKGQSCWAVPSSRSPSLNVPWIHRELLRSTGGMQHEQRMHSYPLWLAGAQAINTDENFTSWICFEPITSKEQFYHAGKRYPQVKTFLQSFVISAGAVMTTLEGITVAGFPFEKYCLL